MMRPRAGLVAIALGGVVSLESHRTPERSGRAIEAPGPNLERLLDGTGPRPVGSRDHDIVRDRIVDELRRIGLETTVEKYFLCDGSTCAHIANVVARLPGKSTDPAVALAAHYDTVGASPGFGDDGAGIAAVLDVAAHLTRSGPGRRSVLFLALDGEEDGLLGARAFATESGFAKNLGALVNLDARGGDGPPLLLETSPRNESLVRSAAAHLTTPIAASSLLTSIYDVVPNLTDATVFKGHGYACLNFAFIGRGAVYHTNRDDGRHLSASTVSELSEQARAVVSGLRDDPGSFVATQSDVFFDVFGRAVARWPEAAARPLGMAPFLAAVTVAISLLRRRPVRRRRALRSAAIVFASFGSLLALAGAAQWAALVAAHDDNLPAWLSDDWSLWTGLLGCGAGLLGAAAALVARNFIGRWPTAVLCTALAAMYGALGVGVAFVAPGAHYPFTLAAFAALLPLVFRGKRLRSAAAFVPAIVAASLFVPLAYVLVQALAPASIIPTAIVSFLAALSWTVAPGRVSARWPAACAAAGVVSLGASLLLSSRRLGETTIANGVVLEDVEAGSARVGLQGVALSEALRGAFPDETDEWGLGRVRSRVVPLDDKLPLLSAEGVRRDSTPDGLHVTTTLRLRGAPAREMLLSFESRERIGEVRVNGRAVSLDRVANVSILRILAPSPGGELLEFSVRGAGPIRVGVRLAWAGLDREILPGRLAYQDGDRTIRREILSF